MAGDISHPFMTGAGDGQAAIGNENNGSAFARASPGTAMQGVAQAGCGAFLSGAEGFFSSHPAIAEAIGAAWALASQIGPNRTSSIIASTARTAVRKTLTKG